MPSATASLLSQMSEITQFRRTLSEGDAKDYLSSTMSAADTCAGGSTTMSPTTTDDDSLDDGFESDFDCGDDRDYLACVQLRTNSCVGMPTSLATFPAISNPWQSCVTGAVQLQLFALLASSQGPASYVEFASPALPHSAAQLKHHSEDGALTVAAGTCPECTVGTEVDCGSSESAPVPAVAASTPTVLPQPVRQSRKRSSEADRGGKSEARRANLPTTICFRNVPNNYNTKMVIELLDQAGFENSYDFLYLPHDFERLPCLVNVGYFFVNFVSHRVAASALAKLTGFYQWKVSSRKVLSGSWAKKTQGKASCIEHCMKYFAFMPDVPKECKPVFFERGEQVHNA